MRIRLINVDHFKPATLVISPEIPFTEDIYPCRIPNLYPQGISASDNCINTPDIFDILRLPEPATWKIFKIVAIVFSQSKAANHLPAACWDQSKKLVLPVWLFYPYTFPLFFQTSILIVLVVCWNHLFVSIDWKPPIFQPLSLVFFLAKIPNDGKRE